MSKCVYNSAVAKRVFVPLPKEVLEKLVDIANREAKKRNDLRIGAGTIAAEIIENILREGMLEEFVGGTSSAGKSREEYAVRDERPKKAGRMR